MFAKVLGHSFGLICLEFKFCKSIRNNSTIQHKFSRINRKYTSKCTKFHKFTALFKNLSVRHILVNRKSFGKIYSTTNCIRNLYSDKKSGSYFEKLVHLTLGVNLSDTLH